MTKDTSINEITSEIIGSAFNVRNMYGRFMLESFYEQVMELELKQRGLSVQRQISIDVNHNGVIIPNAYRIDMVVENKVAIEFKTLRYMYGEEFRQLMTYLKLSGLKVGLLINFGAKNFGIGKFDQRTSSLLKGIYRVVCDYED